MARARDFEGANQILRAPEGVSRDECYDLPIRRETNRVISAWVLTPEELENVNKTSVIWFECWGETHPPILISGHASINIISSETGEFIREPRVEPEQPETPKRVG